MQNDSQVSVKKSFIYSVCAALVIPAFTAFANTLPIRLNTWDVTPQEQDIKVLVPSQADKIYLQVHNLRFGGQLSLKVNSADWINVYNDTVELFEMEDRHNGIGGINSTIRFHIDGSNITAGVTNTIIFRLNGTDGFTTGLRILDIGFIDGSGNRIVLPAPFTEEDPTAWTGYYTDTNSIAAGRTLWEAKNSLIEDFISKTPIVASCASCHFDDGSDLKYFNYANETIVARSRFHGLTEEEGKQIASYIRSLNLKLPSGMEAPGRPWNPPFQPGPGTDPVDTDTQLQKDIKAASWLAGQGLDAVAESDADVLDVMFPNGGTHGEVAEVMDHRATLSVREIPVTIQFPDWNQWLPRIAPEDMWDDSVMLNAVRLGNANNGALPGYLSSENLKVNESPQWLYERLLNELETTGPAAMAAAGDLNNSFADFTWGLSDQWYGSIRHQDKALDELWQASKPGVGFDHMRQGLIRWRAVKAAYLVRDFSLEALSDAAVGSYSPANTPFYKPELLTFPSFQPRGVAWVMAPHITGINFNHFDEQEYENGKLTSNQWYLLQQVLNAGMRRPTNMNVPVDWAYVRIHLHEAYNATGHDYLMSRLYSQIKMFQSRYMDTDVDKQGFSLRTTSPNFFYSENRLEHDIYKGLDVIQPGIWRKLFEEYLHEFMFVMESEDLKTMPRFSGVGTDSARHELNPADYVPTPWTGGTDAYFLRPNEDFATSTYRMLPLLEEDGVNPALLEDFVQWLTNAFPLSAGGDWTGVPYWDTLLTPNNYLYLEDHEDGVSDFAPGIMSVQAIKDTNYVNIAVPNGIPRNGGGSYVGSRTVNVSNARNAAHNLNLALNGSTKVRVSSRNAFAYFAGGNGVVTNWMSVTFNVGGKVDGHTVIMNPDLYNEKFETYETEIDVPAGATAITQIRVDWVRNGTNESAYGHGEVFLDNVMVQDISPTGDTTAPGAPTITDVRETNGFRMQIRYNPSPASDLRGYNLYRWEQGQTSADAVKLNRYPLSPKYDRTYDASADREINYTYAVTAVDKDGNESVFSNTDTDVVTSKLPDILPKQTFALQTYGNLTFMLGWFGVPNQDLIGYKVYRKAAGEPSFSLLTTTDENPVIHEDLSAMDGGTYEYYVNPVTSQGETDNSANTLVINTLELNHPPTFNTTPFIVAAADAGGLYTNSMVSMVTDPDNDPLVFEKLSGPDWLTVSTNGAMVGIPVDGDSGTNTFLVRVSDPYGISDSSDMLLRVISMLEGFRIEYGLNEDGTDDLADASGNGVKNIEYFLYDLGNPTNPVVAKLQRGPSPSSGLPNYTIENDGSFTYSFVRHKSQADYDYVPQTSGNLVSNLWDNIYNAYLPVSTINETLDPNYEIHSMNFDAESAARFFRMQLDPTN